MFEIEYGRVSCAANCRDSVGFKKSFIDRQGSLLSEELHRPCARNNDPVIYGTSEVFAVERNALAGTDGAAGRA